MKPSKQRKSFCEMKGIKKRAVRFLFLILYLVVACDFPIFADAQEGRSKEELFYILKNKDASLENREIALQKLSQEPSETLDFTLIEILENPNESKILKSKVINMMAAHMNPRLAFELSRRATDQSLPSDARHLFLHVLWKSDPNIAMQTARSIIDVDQDLSLRISAVAYLCQDPEDSQNKKLALGIIQNKFQPDPLKEVLASCFEVEEEAKPETSQR